MMHYWAWFTQERWLDTPVHGPVLKGEVLDLHQRTVNGCTFICFKLKLNVEGV